MHDECFEERQLYPAELCTFFCQEYQFGIDILKVNEINKKVILTPVPQAPDCVLGLMNLRGRIVTIIDLAKKLGFSYKNNNEKECKIIIVYSQDEYIGLLVDQIGDVVRLDFEKIEPPPVNINSLIINYLTGVLKLDSGLIGILDVESVLN
ncbi:chemotaxis protein CheW [Desulfobacterales bacterium HSG17]|nr:chemotaxis protein CheW [Desulfobacterales bacterium HSG17]